MYDINPCKMTAKKVRRAQAEKVKQSIAYLIQECTTKIKIQHEEIDNALLSLRNLERLLPEIHFYHHQLQNAMRKQDIPGAKAYLLKLVNVINQKSQCDDWISVSTLHGSEWENFVVSEAIRLTQMDCGKYAELNPLNVLELAATKDILNTALCMIARHDPDLFDEIHEQVRVIKLFNGRVTMGLTDLRILGAMLIRIPRLNVNPLLYYLEHIVHEASHIHLNCVMAVDPLILNLPQERYKSPLRADLRPMIGVFHATYVSTRIARTFLKLYEATQNEQLLQPLAENLDEVIRGLVEIEKNAKLTLNGRELIVSMAQFVEKAKCLPEWKNYNFKENRVHRFGSGFTKVADFEREVA